MTTNERATVLIVILLWAVAAGWLVSIRAQERSVHETRVYRLAGNVNGGIVSVIDTEGVCLYVATSNDARIGQSIAAVPKTQLPKGAGCR